MSSCAILHTVKTLYSLYVYLVFKKVTTICHHLNTIREDMCKSNLLGVNKWNITVFNYSLIIGNQSFNLKNFCSGLVGVHRILALAR